LLGNIGQNQPRPAKDLGLVQDCDIIGQGLEAYHVCRVASVLAQGKILNRTTPHFSAVTARFFSLVSLCRVDTTQRDQFERSATDVFGVKHLQILKMFGKPRCTAATGQGADTEKSHINYKKTTLNSMC
jgi:hypothetical protein